MASASAPSTAGSKPTWSLVYAKLFSEHVCERVLSFLSCEDVATCEAFAALCTAAVRRETENEEEEQRLWPLVPTELSWRGVALRYFPLQTAGACTQLLARAREGGGVVGAVPPPLPRFGSWRELCLCKARVRTDGMYVLKAEYIKKPVHDMWSTPLAPGSVLKVTFYRCFRFLLSETMVEEEDDDEEAAAEGEVNTAVADASVGAMGRPPRLARVLYALSHVHPVQIAREMDLIETYYRTLKQWKWRRRQRRCLQPDDVRPPPPPQQQQPQQSRSWLPPYRRPTLEHKDADEGDGEEEEEEEEDLRPVKPAIPRYIFLGEYCLRGQTVKVRLPMPRQQVEFEFEVDATGDGGAPCSRLHLRGHSAQVHGQPPVNFRIKSDPVRFYRVPSEALATVDQDLIV